MSSRSCDIAGRGDTAVRHYKSGIFARLAPPAGAEIGGGWRGWACGWSDQGEQWKAAPKEMRPAILDRILNDGQRREQVRELMAEAWSVRAAALAGHA